VRFQCVELSVAGLSMREVSSAVWEQAVQEACHYIKQQLLPGEDFVFVGHCWGSLLAFEVSHHLKDEGFPQPLHLFLSGCNAPHLLRPSSVSVRTSGLLTPECGCHPAEAYHTPVNRAPLHARLSIFIGKKDEHALVDRSAEWSRYTARICDVHVYEGDHTYLQFHAFKWLHLAQTIVEREYLIV
jgi:surfactin synthase thioesterase subunit